MPPEHEAINQAFYDHEQDEPRGRRRRAVADWGVSEDVFDRMPSRRFVRRGEESRRRDEAPRGESRVLVVSAGDARDEVPSGRFARGEDAPRVRAARGDDELRAARGAGAPQAGFEGEDGAVRDEIAQTRAGDAEPRRYDDWGVDELYEQRPVSQTIVIEREPEDAVAEEPAPSRAVEGRRTIVIGGHPDRLPVARTRPPRTALDRIGPRPDRIVAYAVGLGFLLILIAILTSH